MESLLAPNRTEDDRGRGGCHPCDAAPDETSGADPYHPEEYLPGPSVGDDAQSLAKAAGDIGTTIFHPVGTAKMGQPSDPLAAVDERLRVFGVDGLRIIDASIMPTITSGNTNTPTAMIADRGSEMVLSDRR